MLEDLLAELRMIGLLFRIDPQRLIIEATDYIPNNMGNDLTDIGIQEIIIQLDGISDYSKLKGTRFDGLLTFELRNAPLEVILPKCEVKRLYLHLRGNCKRIDVSKVCLLEELIIAIYQDSAESILQLRIGKAASSLKRIVLGGVGIIKADLDNLLSLTEMSVNIPTVFISA